MWILILLLLLSTRPAFAQDASNSAQTPPTASASATATATPVPPSPTPTPRLFLQYQSDYLYQYDLYQQSYLKYTEKKQVYTKYGTITTQKDKFDASVDAINARNRALRSYLIALRVYLDDYKSANPTETEKAQIELSKWEAWFDEQITVVSAIGNQDDLTKWVATFKTNYITVQQAIATALVRQEANIRQTTLDQLQATANDIKANPDIKPESQEWISTLAVKSDLVSTSINDALKFTTKTQNQNKFSDFYPDSKIALGKANDYLKEITTDLKLIVNKFYKK